MGVFDLWRFFILSHLATTPCNGFRERKSNKDFDLPPTANSCSHVWVIFVER